MRAAEGAPRGPRRCRSRCRRCGGSNISYLSLSLLTLRCQGRRAGGGQIANAVSFPYWRGTWGREGGKKGVFAHSGFALELGSLLPKDAPSCALLLTSHVSVCPLTFRRRTLSLEPSEGNGGGSVQRLSRGGAPWLCPRRPQRGNSAPIAQSRAGGGGHGVSAGRQPRTCRAARSFVHELHERPATLGAPSSRDQAVGHLLVFLLSPSPATGHGFSPGSRADPLPGLFQAQAGGAHHL